MKTTITILREAMEKLARLGNGDHYGNSTGNSIAIAALQATNSTESTQSDTTAQAGQEPIAVLHDDGYYTWKGAKPYEAQFAGWRMDVYAAPPAPANAILTFDNGIQIPIISDGKGFKVHPDYLKVGYTVTDQLTIVQAALDAAADISDAQFERNTPMQIAGGQDGSYMSGYRDGSGDCGNIIRAIDPQTILDGMTTGVSK